MNRLPADKNDALGRAPGAFPFRAPPRGAGPSAQDHVRLGLLRVIGRLYARPQPTTAPRSVLLIRPDHLGDMLFATPAFRNLRLALPHARLTLLAGPWGQGAVARNPDLDEVRLCRFPGFERQPKTNPVAPYRLLFETARLLRGQFDTALVLRFDHWWGAWLAAAAGIPCRIGYDQPATRPFLTDARPYRPGRHEVIQNSALVAALTPGAAGDPGPLRFDIAPSAQVWATEWLRSHGADAGQPLVAIHPGAGAAVKQWPPMAWAQVADRLTDALGARILLTGGASERPLTDAIAAKIRGPVLNAAGQTTLDQLAALLARCQWVLGSDSGPLHLAVAVGTPTVHLYGPVSADKFGPWGDPACHVVLQTPWPCAPCDRLDWPAAALPAHACMAAISVDAVVNAVQTASRPS